MSSSEMMMCERRPAWLQLEIDNVFQLEKSGEMAHWYTEDGRLETYDRMFSGYDTSDAILNEAEETLGHRPSVLELGAGLGAFMLRLQELGYEVQGVSGVDYRSDEARDHMRGPTLAIADIPNRLAAETYLVGDAHNLNSIPGLRTPVDVIIAKDFIYHLVDPLSVIEQTMNIVEVGGKVACKDLILRRIMSRTGALQGVLPDDFTMPDLLNMFAEKGFRSTYTTDPQGEPPKSDMLSGLVLHREDHFGAVRLPIGYERQDEIHWKYKLTG